MSEILYNFGQNANSLGDINGHLNATQEIRGDIDGIFNTLATVYEGEGSMALNQAHIKVSQMLDEALNNVLNTQKQAQDQQDAMQAMDRANAAAF
jgi:flagellar hook-basal body complex protein FliE